MQLRSALLHLTFAAALAACDRGNAATPPTRRADSSSVDRYVPRDEALRTFRAGLVEATELGDGAPTRDSLVAAYVHAMETADTAALRRMEVTRAEFAWLYYPTTPQSLPPYDLAPDLMWMIMHGHSDGGLRKALERYAGKPLQVLSYDCDSTASREGRNTVYGPCWLHRVTQQGDTIDERLFTQIIEREGKFKFLNYSNKLD